MADMIRTYRLLPVPEATCIVCGCTDSKACAEGCGWADVDRRNGTGTCTNCIDGKVIDIEPELEISDSSNLARRFLASPLVEDLDFLEAELDVDDIGGML